MMMPVEFGGNIKLFPIADVYIDSSSPSTNLNNGNLRAGYDDNHGKHRSYLRFDLSSLDSYAVTGANFNVDAIGGEGSLTVNLHYVTNDGWAESSTTWNNKPSHGQIVDSVSMTGGTFGWQVFDVGSIINEPDNTLSIALVSAEEETTRKYVGFYSRDNDYPLRPYLNVTVMEDVQNIIINEFMPYPNTGDSEWIEVYNPGTAAYDTSGCVIRNKLEGVIAELNGAIPAGGFAAYDINSFDELRNSAYMMKLECFGLVVDQVVYGPTSTWDTDGNSANNAPVGDQGESVGRSPNGRDTNADNNDFAVFSTPTKGTSNVASCNTDADANCDGCVSLVEIVGLMLDYKTGGTSLSLLEMVNLMLRYKGGEISC